MYVFVKIIRGKNAEKIPGKNAEKIPGKNSF